jgi:hypothetical protein
MKPIRLATFVICLACTAARGQVSQSADCSPQIDKALEVTGVKDFVDQMPAQIRSQVGAQFKTTNRQLVMRATLRMFDPAGLLRGLKQAYLRNCEPEMLQSVVATLDTPLGRRMRKLEAFAATAEGSQETAAYRRELMLHPASDVRYALAERLDQLTGASEFALAVAVGVAKGTAAAVGRPMLTDVELSSLRTQTLPFIRSAQIMSALFTYRDVSDEDLKQYVAMYELPALQQFTKIFESAFVGTIDKQSQQAALDRRPQ